MRRGDIWWAYLPPPIGIRPVLLLMRDEAYVRRSQVILSPITTHVRQLPTEVALGIAEGLMLPSVVNLDVIMTSNKDLLSRRIGTISPDKMRQVDAALRFALGMKH